MSTTEVNASYQHKRPDIETKQNGLQYTKNKKATNGAIGHLYELKLNALILYRLLNNPKIKEFYMGSNLDEIGDMDDVCIRLTHEDSEKPLLILIQAKNKDAPSKIRSQDLYRARSAFYLPKSFNSLLLVKKKFDTIDEKKLNDDAMFSGEFDDVIPYFVFYTPAVSDFTDEIKRDSKHIDIVKDLIDSRKDDGDFFKFKEIIDLEKITNNANEKDIAKFFFENLYFCTNQEKEDGIDRELEKEIAINLTTKGSTFQVQPNAVYSIFYNHVYKWWLTQGKTFYLTKTCPYLNSTLNDYVINGYLTILTYNCVNQLEFYPIGFNEKSMLSTEKLLKCNVIISNSTLLTSIKLKQYLKERKGFSYLDYHFVSRMSECEFSNLFNEIEKTNMTILIIIDATKKVKIERLKKITNEFRKNIVVTEASQAIDFGNLDDVSVETDYIRGLVDIENDEHILKYKIIVQGKEIYLNNIIDDNSKYIVNAEILLTILNNECLELGRSLFNYDHKYLFDREVSNKKEKYTLDTFNEIKDKKSNVIVITAESGMGKSTLLTDLSAKMKTADSKTWIAKIHLQEYSDDFKRWLDDETEVGVKESMLLICKAELNATKGDILFDLKINNSRLEVANAGVRGTSLLLLKYIVHCFNEGNILYLFDGFDKICPHYKKIVVKFIKNLIPTKDKKKIGVGPQVWITSRPYNVAKRVLRAEFTEPLSLVALSKSQQKEFYTRYWQANINKKNLNINDSNKHIIKGNINNFFNKMSQNFILTSIHLDVMYETACSYLQKEYDCDEIEINKLTYRPDEQIKQELQLSGIPLYMELYANHFSKHLIENVLTTEKAGNSQKSDIWRCDTFQFFEDLHDTEFDKVFYKSSKPFNPDARARCRRARNISNLRHRKLAFYSLFHDVNDREYYNKIPELKTLEGEIPIIIDNIKNGKEKIGFIDNKHHGLPKFSNQTFAECYAVEFIVDVLKSYGTEPIGKSEIQFLINRLFDNKVGLMSVFDQKLKSDKMLLKMLSKPNNKKTIYKLLMMQSRDNNSLFNALDNGFKEIAKILVHSIECVMDIHKIRRFVEFITPDFFVYAASLNYIDLLNYVIGKIRLDDSMVDKISRDITVALNINSFNIERCQIEVMVERLRDLGIVL